MEGVSVHGDHVVVNAAVKGLRLGIVARCAQRGEQRQQVFVAGVGAHAGRLGLAAEESTVQNASFQWPTGTLLILGLLAFAGMSAEGAMYDWSVLYLQQDVALPQAQAAWGYAAFSGAMAAARFGGDALRTRYPERSLLRAGGALSAIAMALVLVTAHPVVAFIGLGLVGAGLAMVVPILYNAASRVPGQTRANAIATVSAIGYSGFLLGPPVIGGVAQLSSLTWALALVVPLAGLLAWGARHVPQNPLKENS